MSDRIDYINIDEALSRIGCKMDLYTRLIRQFSKDDYIAPLETALSKGESAEAIRHAHTLKGVASNLSLNKLATAATDLEDALRDGVPHSDALAAVKQAYHKTSQFIAEMFRL